MAKTKPVKPPAAKSTTRAASIGLVPSLATIILVLVALLALVIPVLGRLYAESSAPVSTLYCVADPDLSVTTSPFKIRKANSKSKALSPSCFRVSHETGRFTEILRDFPTSQPVVKDVVFLSGHVLPGLIDGHGHLAQYGEMRESVVVYDATSMEEVRSKIKEYLAGYAMKEGNNGKIGSRENWIRGIGWDQKFWGGVMPTADELSQDPELKDLYIVLARVDVHCVLVSQKVLDLLPNPLPESPPGGEVITSPGPGVFCDNAMDELIFPLAPKPDAAAKTRWYQRAFSDLNSVGITSVTDAGMRVEDVAVVEAMIHESPSSSLPVRITAMLECATRNTFCPSEFAAANLSLLSGPVGSPTPSLSLGGVKLFADGALGSWGAALLEPYTDRPDTSGTMLIEQGPLAAVVKQWAGASFQVNIHAIGDRAFRAAVDALKGALCPEQVCDCPTGLCNEERRLRIEHSQIIDPMDMWLMQRLGIIPSIQPTHATSDMGYALERLGKERLEKSAYRMKSLFPPGDARSKEPRGFTGPVLGSDFPVEPPNPWHGMYAAVTRRNPNQDSGSEEADGNDEGWYPSEALTVPQAFLGFTRNAAYGMGLENEVGAIEVGMWADWVVVDRNIFADETGKSLKDVVVRETWVGGRKVFDIDAEEKSSEKKATAKGKTKGHEEL